MQKLFFSIALFFSVMGLTSPVFAQVYEAPQTLGETSSVISVNKVVQKPGSTAYSENLGTNDPKYLPGNTVPFRITVTNTGNTTLSNIQITDTFPAYMVHDKDMKPTAVFMIPTLEAGKSYTATVSGKIADATSLPNDQRIFCLVNRAAATSGDQTSTDNTQFCVENTSVEQQVTSKGGQPVYGPSAAETTPKTGPEMLTLAALIPGGIIGHLLRKKVK